MKRVIVFDAAALGHVFRDCANPESHKRTRAAAIVWCFDENGQQLV
jgi:hypothetical protein